MMTDQYWSWWKDNWQGKTEVFAEKRASMPFFHLRFQMGLNVRVCDEKL
jgi:hypothetical protein